MDSSRTQLRIRLEMVDTFKDNFLSKYFTLDIRDRDPGHKCGNCWQSRTHSPTFLCVRPRHRPGTGWTSPVLRTWWPSTSACSMGGRRWRRRRGGRWGLGLSNDCSAPNESWVRGCLLICDSYLISKHRNEWSVVKGYYCCSASEVQFVCLP